MAPTEPWYEAAICASAHATQGHPERRANDDEAVIADRRDPIGPCSEPQLDRNDSSRGRVFPFRVPSFGDSNKAIATILSCLGIAGEPAAVAEYVATEMLRNSFEHSCSASGPVLCARRTSALEGQLSLLRIGVADAGIGICASLSRRHLLDSEAEALVYAIRPGVTGAITGMYGTSPNAGAGLFMLHSIARLTGGRLTLASGSAALRAEPNPRPGRGDLVTLIPEYPGTVIGVDIGLHEGLNTAELLRSSWRAFALSPPSAIGDARAP